MMVIMIIQMIITMKIIINMIKRIKKNIVKAKLLIIINIQIIVINILIKKKLKIDNISKNIYNEFSNISNITDNNKSYLKLHSIIVNKYKKYMCFNENNNKIIDLLKIDRINNVIKDAINISYNKELYIYKN